MLVVMVELFLLLIPFLGIIAGGEDVYSPLHSFSLPVLSVRQWGLLTLCSGVQQTVWGQRSPQQLLIRMWTQFGRVWTLQHRSKVVRRQCFYLAGRLSSDV